MLRSVKRCSLLFGMNIKLKALATLRENPALGPRDILSRHDIRSNFVQAPAMQFLFGGVRYIVKTYRTKLVVTERQLLSDADWRVEVRTRLISDIKVHESFNQHLLGNNIRVAVHSGFLSDVYCVDPAGERYYQVGWRGATLRVV